MNQTPISSQRALPTGRKFTCLAASFCVLFLGFLIFSYSTFEEVRINGPLYRRLALERDLVADLLPPPEQLIESYLVVLDSLQDPQPERIQQAIRASRKLTADLESGHEYWASRLPEGPLRAMLLGSAIEPARQFAALRDRQFFPALLAGNREAALRIAHGPLKTLYVAHRRALEQIVAVARDGIRHNEEATAAKLNQRSWWLAGWGIACLLIGAALFGGLFFSASVAALSSVVSRQKRKLSETESELRASRLLLQTVFDHLPLGVHVKSLDGRYKMVNRTMAERWEANSSEIIGKVQFEVASTARMTPQERAPSLQADKAVVETGKVIDFEMERSLPTGRRRLRVLKAPIRDSYGRINSILTLSEDVTDKVRAMQDLERSQNLLSAVFDNIPIEIALKDRSGRHLMVNRTLAAQLNVEPESVIGTKWGKGLLPGVPDSERDIIERADMRVLAGETLSYEMVRSFPGGQRNISVLKVPVRDAEGTVTMGLTLAEDTTESVRVREELQRSQQLLQTVFDTIPHIVVVKDLDSRYAMVNRTWQEVFGYDARSVVGKLPCEIPGRNPADADWITTQNRELLCNQGGAAEIDVALTDKHGQVRKYRTTRNLLRDGAGAVIGSVAVSSDVTKERLTSERLRSSQSQLQDAIECMPAGFFLFDADERLVKWNSRVIEYFGSAAGVLRVGATCEELVRFSAQSSKEAHGREEAWIKQRLEHFRYRPGVYYDHNLDDGRWLQGIEHRTSDGGTVSLRLDVSELKNAESSARKSQRLLQAVFDTVPEVLSVKDLDGRFLAVNRTFLQTFGLPEGRVVGSSHTSLGSDPEADAQIISMDNAAIQTGAIQRAESVGYTMPSGETRYFRVVKTPLHSEDGLIMGTVGSSEDITETRQAREKERALETQLQQAQKMEVVGRLAAGVAHDFNNLLTPIMGYAEIGLADLSPDSELRVPLEQIQKAGGRASELTRSLLAFGRRQILDTRSLDLGKEISGIVPMMQRLIGTNIEIRTDIAEPLSQVLADAGQIHQVLMNLIVNARDAMREGGAITIAVHDKNIGASEAGEELPPGAYVALSISDTGCGMDGPTLARIFEPFFTTKELGKGTGLGLAIVHGIVRQHRGGIRVASVPGTGTTFTVYLPVGTTSADSVVAPAHEIKAPRGMESVLVVDDEPLVRSLVGYVLRTQGYLVTEAADPDAALELVRQDRCPPAVIVSDLVMPKMNGLQLYRRLAASRPDMKVLFISGHSFDSLQDMDWSGSSPRILRKPFSVLQLANAVRDVLDTRRESAGENQA